MAIRSVDDLLRQSIQPLKPREHLSRSDWAERHFQVTKGSSTGRWKTRPYQREILDAWDDPRVWRTSIMKSSRVGAALHVDTPIPTTAGWKRIEDLKEGDVVFDENGKPCNVTYRSPVYTDHKCYQITFCDRSQIIADAGHRWYVELGWTLEHLLAGGGFRGGRPGYGETATKNTVIDTETLAKVFLNFRGVNTASIPNTKPLQMPEEFLLVPPYTLGLWLGDGHSDRPWITQHRPDLEIVEYMRQEGVDAQIAFNDKRHPDNACIKFGGEKIADNERAPTIMGHLLEVIGVKNNKHIPLVYLRASIKQRLALLQGLMDSDGCVSKGGRAEFAQSNETLARDVYELIISLGMKATITRHEPLKKRVKGTSPIISKQDRYRISFKADPALNPFRLKRKAERVPPLARPTITKRRKVVNVSEVPPAPVCCISVDSPSHLYLAGKSMIPTHNTTLLNIDECYAIHWQPCDSCTVQPTTGDAEKYSRDTFNALVENIDVMAELFSVCKHRDGTNSILEKYINGASLKFIGANSPNGFRRVTYRIVRADETSAYKAGGAGKEGDQIELLLNRTIDYHDRLFIDCSTPTIEGFDRIESAFALGDQRHRFLPCPHCGHFQRLSAAAFTPGAKKDTPGGFWWEPGKPSTVVYICEHCDKPIQHSQKFEMDEAGEWRPMAPPNIDPNGREHRSYHIWAGISYQANASWANIVAEYEKNQASPQGLQVFINTWLGLPYREDASTRLTAESLYARRDAYTSGTVPDGVLMICIGVDMQDDRAEIFVWGFGPGDSETQAGAEPERWLIEHAVIFERYDTKAVYAQIDTYVLGDYPLSDGKILKPAATAIDSGDGDHAPYVYEYANSRMKHNVIATKGMPQPGKPPINNGKRTEYDMKGRPKKTGAMVYQVGTDGIKTRLMAQLKHGHESGAGAIHFPNDTTEEFFTQLVSERRHYSTIGGQPKVTWVRRQGVRAEALDGTVYADAAFHHAKKKYNPKKMWEQIRAAIEAQGKPAPERSAVAFNLLEGQKPY